MAPNTDTTDADSIEAKIVATAQELQSLGDCEGVPEDTSKLSESEQERFQQLKKKLVYQKQMREANQQIAN